jgi:mannose/fructose/N-acetylgalactosamine-specific phosphotransferase system component IID
MLTNGARSVWSTLVWLVLVMLPVQFFLAGYGAFAFKHGTTTTRDNDWTAHAAFGSIIGLVVILVLISGLLSRLPRQQTGMTVGLFVLMIVQIVLAGIGDSVSWIGALHPVNALLITGLTMSLAIRAREYLPFGRSQAASARDGAATAFADR